MAVCDSDGVRFEYPEEWSLSREARGADVMFYLQTEGTGFWSLTLLADRPSAEETVDAAVQAFRDEYSDVDTYEDMTSLSMGPAAGCELDFVCMDLVSSASIRAEATSEFTALVVCQAENREFDTLRAQFDAIAASLRYSGDVDDDPL